ncbi:MAG: pilin [Patescibacteria group bacterium]|jgi:amino acid transporter
MKRFLLTLTIALSALLVFPATSNAANLPPIIPGCDQTQYTVSGTNGNKETIPPGTIIDSSLYGTDAFPLTTVTVTGYSLSRDCQLTDFLQVFINLYSWGLYIISVLALVFMFVGGGTLLFAAGSEERVRTGKTVLKNTILGLLIALSSWIIVNLALVAILPDTEENRKDGVAHIIKNQPWFKVENDAPACQPNVSPTYGCKSQTVRDYQTKLSSKRCFPSPNGENITSIFDNNTMAAWLNLQGVNKVVPPTNRLEDPDNYSVSCL